MIILNNFPTFLQEKCLEFGSWSSGSGKQKSWKIVEKHGKFSVTVTELQGQVWEGDGEAKDCNYKINILVTFFIFT